MSRSYKKHNHSTWARGWDTPFRKMYHKARRTKETSLCKEAEKEFNNGKFLFKPYETSCPLYKDICCRDDDFYNEDIKKYFEGEPPVDLDHPCSPCIGCPWSENHYDDKGRIIDYIWEEDAGDRFPKEIDRSVRLSDRWTWPRDCDKPPYRGSKVELAREMDEKIFGINNQYVRRFQRKVEEDIWGSYIKHKKGEVYLSKEDWFDFLFLTNKIPLTFTEPEALVNWLRKNYNKILNSFYRYLTSK